MDDGHFSVKAEDSWDESYDVIIIGSGFAGLSAAIEAGSLGASVLVLEKMHAAGGNSVISDGGIAAAGTHMQDKFGIHDSADIMCADMLRAGQGLNDPLLVKKLSDLSADAFEWTQDVLGVKYYDRVDIFGGHSVPRCYTPLLVSGAAILKCMLQKIAELKIEIRFKSYLQEIIPDSTGRICGAAVRENWDYKTAGSGNSAGSGTVTGSGTVRRIKASKAVILASGGFGADVAFRSDLDPRLTAAVETTNKPFATAEVLVEAIRIGSAPVDLSQIQLGPWASPDEKGYGDGARFAEYIVFPYGMIVDPDTGLRFTSELADRKTLSDQLLCVGHPCIGIADQYAVLHSGWDIEGSLNKGIVHPFDSLESLCAFYQIPFLPFAETCKKFNEMFISGIDSEFGKPLLENARPISITPYFAIRLWPKVHYTMGGIQINGQSQVINTAGDIIPGLYAAGEVTGGIHGASRLGSCSITDCIVFGRIAGKNAANTREGTYGTY